MATNANTTARQIAALCVSGRSIYKHLPGVVAFDRVRDARTFKGNMPVVAHPPCRHWSKYLSHQAKAQDPESEMQLGRWCVEQVLTHGGVLEHPAHSRLFEACQLPRPNQPAHVLLYTIYIEQGWFGYATRKPTWVLVCGVPRRFLPTVPIILGGASNANTIAAQSQFDRSRTVQSFAEWLCQVARLTWFSLPEKTEGQDSGRFEKHRSNRIVARRFVPKAAPDAKSLVLNPICQNGEMAYNSNEEAVYA